MRYSHNLWVENALLPSKFWTLEISVRYKRDPAKSCWLHYLPHSQDTAPKWMVVLGSGEEIDVGGYIRKTRAAKSARVGAVYRLSYPVNEIYF